MRWGNSSGWLNSVRTNGIKKTAPLSKYNERVMQGLIWDGSILQRRKVMRKPYRPMSSIILMVGWALVTVAGSEIDERTQKVIDAAGQGDAKAQETLGFYYRVGWKVPKDQTEAIKWYRKAAEQGYAKAQYSLGAMYFDHRGVTSDYPVAIKWFWKAAEQGHAEAYRELSEMYEAGKGVPKIENEAVNLLKKAAMLGDRPSQQTLAARYQIGRGVPRDIIKAYAWYNVAGANGDPSASKSRDLIATEMTPDQIADAQRLSGEWFRESQSKND